MLHYTSSITLSSLNPEADLGPGFRVFSSTYQLGLSVYNIVNIYSIIKSSLGPVRLIETKAPSEDNRRWAERLGCGHSFVVQNITRPLLARPNNLMRLPVDTML